jgi:hypothetical protein
MRFINITVVDSDLTYSVVVRMWVKTTLIVGPQELRPLASPSATLLDQWNEIGRKFIAMAEDFPEDKYDYKPAADRERSW